MGGQSGAKQWARGIDWRYGCGEWRSLPILLESIRSLFLLPEHLKAWITERKTQADVDGMAEGQRQGVDDNLTGRRFSRMQHRRYRSEGVSGE